MWKPRPHRVREEDLTMPWFSAGMTMSVKPTWRRKSVGFRIMDTHVAINAPNNMLRHTLLAIIDNKQSWILRKVHFNTKVRTQPLARNYETGDIFYFLGHMRELEVSEGAKSWVGLDLGELFVKVPARISTASRCAQVRKLLHAWYKGEAQRIVAHSITLYAPALEVQPVRVEYRNYKSRWGTCTSEGVLRFNWRIVCAPMRFINYVVVHELCHLVHPNHSPAFWALVATQIPDYREIREWARVHGAELTV